MSLPTPPEIETTAEQRIVFRSVRL
jgi:hypothetical protein